MLRSKASTLKEFKVALIKLPKASTPFLNLFINILNEHQNSAREKRDNNIIHNVSAQKAKIFIRNTYEKIQYSAPPTAAQLYLCSSRCFPYSPRAHYKSQSVTTLLVVMWRALLHARSLTFLCLCSSAWRFLIHNFCDSSSACVPAATVPPTQRTLAVTLLCAIICHHISFIHLFILLICNMMCVMGAIVDLY